MADVIIVVNLFSDEIYQLCIQENIGLEKMVFMVRGSLKAANNPIENLKEILGERNYTDYQMQYCIKENTFVDTDAEQYQKLNTRKNFEIQKAFMWLIIYDKYAKNGTMGNYFLQDLWAARKTIQFGVQEHYDIAR